MTKKTSSRAGVRVSSTRPSTGSTAPRRRVPRRTQSERQPTTAYELCELVAQHIEDEPRRYNQGSWAIVGKARIEELMGYTAPTCGTVCCRAGWIVALNDGLGAKLLVNAQRIGWEAGQAVGARANQILGIDDQYDTAELFDSDALSAERDNDDDPLPAKGTPEYAALGASGLRKWMQEHATHLKARLLKDVPKLEGK